MKTDALKQLEFENSKLKVDLKRETARRENADRAYEYLMHQYKQLARSQFGASSEKYEDSDHLQQSLFENTKDISDDPSSSDENQGDNVIEISAYRRKKKKSKKEPSRRIVIIPANNKICHCGSHKKVIRFETSEHYHFQPAVFEIIEERREVVACQIGCNDSIETAKKPQHVLPKIKASHSLLSHIIISKFVDRQPLYHLEKQFLQRFGDVRAACFHVVQHLSVAQQNPHQADHIVATPGTLHIGFAGAN